MKSNFKIETPDEIECTLRVTMKLRGWKDVRKALVESRFRVGNIHIDNFIGSINDLVVTAQREFEQAEPEKYDNPPLSKDDIGKLARRDDV